MVATILAVLVYLFIAIGSARTMMPYQYRALRKHMTEDDARREAVKLSWQNGFLWPAYVVTGAVLLPLVVVFDGLPWAARQTGKSLAAAGRAAAPALAPALGPVTTWATRPLALEVQRDQARALAARADEPLVSDEPLVPDEIARWEPPVKRHVFHGTDPFDDYQVIEHYDGRGPRIEFIRETRKRNARREEA